MSRVGGWDVTALLQLLSYVQLVAIERDWMRVPNLKFGALAKGGVEVGGARGCTSTFVVL